VKTFRYRRIPEKLPRLKETVTPAGKLYNWNTLTDLFKTVDVKLE